MAMMRDYWRSGQLFVWMTGAAVAVSLSMIGGLLVLIALSGLGQFWISPVEEFRLAGERTVIGQVVGQEVIPREGSSAQQGNERRFRVRVGNRDLFGVDFRWIAESEIRNRTAPTDVVVVERTEWGPAYGYAATLEEDGRPIAQDGDVWTALPAVVARTRELLASIRSIERGELARINQRLAHFQIRHRPDAPDAKRVSPDPESLHDLDVQIAELERAYRVRASSIESLTLAADRHTLVLHAAGGQSLRIPVRNIATVLRPNTLSWHEKAGLYASRLWSFLVDEPREANTEGGIFPAIYGTVLLVFLMTLAVIPFGVMAAVYLREYARQGLLVRLVRIAVNNLAGVPSIVFGVFGLGCFVYAAGGAIDRWFYADVLPNPTFGTGGLLWASLTLALLTVPVVIVATEEGLSAVPREFREGSIGLGATKFETIWHVVLPCALPGILTGMILAMARAAGEVAPLMLTGVVKLAPALPLDGQFPFLHLDRKFMHLGFHIYDVGFQSPNVEAAKPMVYMTTLTLIVVVVVLNLVAAHIRNRIRRRFGTSPV